MLVISGKNCINSCPTWMSLCKSKMSFLYMSKLSVTFLVQCSNWGCKMQVVFRSRIKSYFCWLDGTAHIKIDMFLLLQSVSNNIMAGGSDNSYEGENSITERGIQCNCSELKLNRMKKWITKSLSWRKVKGALEINYCSFGVAAYCSSFGDGMS